MLTTSSFFYWKIQIPQPLKETDKVSDIKNRHLDKSGNNILSRPKLKLRIPPIYIWQIKKVEIIPFCFVVSYICFRQIKKH